MSKRSFPLVLKHKNGGTLIARNEVMAGAFEREGFVEVKESKKKEDK